MKTADIAREIIRLGHESPDFVYDSNPGGCTYLKEVDGKLVGDCIVGQALVNLGIDREVLIDADNRLKVGAGKRASSIIKGLDTDLNGYEPLLDVIDNVQQDQDDQICWGDAIRHLTENYPELY